MNTDFWADRLSEAIDADDARENDDRLLAASPRPGASWTTVPNWVLVAALIGHPTEADADAILGDAATLQSLRDRWSADPPTAELHTSAETNVALARLLVATGQAAGVGGDLADSARSDSSGPDGPTDADPTVSMTARPVPASRAGYRLAAGTQAPARTIDLPGGQLTSQAMPDGATSIAVEYSGALVATLPRTQLVAWVSSADGDRLVRFVVILIRSGVGTGSSVIGRINVPAGAVVEPLSSSAPLPINGLWAGGALDVEALTESVAYAPLVWKEAWRQVAIRVGSGHPFARAVERGLARRPL